jgi:uncharacterized OB-fold protein
VSTNVPTPTPTPTPLGDDWTLPGLSPLNRTWFTAGELAVQSCATCGTLQHPPEEICHKCGSMDLTTVAVAPRGTVYSYTVAHYPAHRALAEHVPYAVVLVSLDEHPGIRVIGNVLDVPPEEVRIGMPVVATWQERTNAEGESLKFLQWVSA